MAGKFVGSVVAAIVALTLLTDAHAAMEAQIAQVSACIDRLGPTTVGPCT